MILGLVGAYLSVQRTQIEVFKLRDGSVTPRPRVAAQNRLAHIRSRAPDIAEATAALLGVPVTRAGMPPTPGRMAVVAELIAEGILPRLLERQLDAEAHIGDARWRPVSDLLELTTLPTRRVRCWWAELGSVDILPLRWDPLDHQDLDFPFAAVEDVLDRLRERGWAATGVRYRAGFDPELEPLAGVNFALRRASNRRPAGITGEVALGLDNLRRYVHPDEQPWPHCEEVAEPLERAVSGDPDDPPF